MSGLPYWTPADAAELDVLVFEFVRVHEIHVAACETCRGGPWCSRLRESFEAILDWKQARTLRSKATYLRLREFERERLPGRVRIVFDERGEVIEYELAPARFSVRHETSTTAGRELATVGSTRKSRWTRNY